MIQIWFFYNLFVNISCNDLSKLKVIVMQQVIDEMTFRKNKFEISDVC